MREKEEEENKSALHKIKSTDFIINSNYLGSTCFQNEEIERNFLKENLKSSSFYDTLANMMMVLGYFSYGVYLYLVFYRVVLFNLNFFCFIFSIVIYVSHIYVNKKIKISKFYVDQILIFISYLNTLAKVYYVVFIMENKKEEHSAEILRCLFYSFLSTYLYVLMKIENCFYTYVFYMTTHLLAAYLSEANSDSSHFYYIEWAFGTMLGFIFLYFRKLWEVNKRNVYLEKRKFDLLYNFTKGLLRDTKNNNKSQNSVVEHSEILNENFTN